MPYLLNLLYLLVLLALSPVLVYRAFKTGKHRRGVAAKLLGRVGHPLLTPRGSRRGPRVWFHGVSVGEIHLLRQLVAAWRQRHPHGQVVISTSTDTGFDEARKCFPDLAVIWWPFDFTWAVKAALERVQPDLVVLAECEIWPNFVTSARRRGVKVAIVNGRMSPRSAGRFHKLRGLVAGLFARFDVIAAQTQAYAEQYRRLGAASVMVTGSVKYDGAQSDRANARTQALRQMFRIERDELVWVAGSTQAPEEEIVLNVYRQARAAHPKLRLILVPRQKDRFDPVARLLETSGLPFVRRSALGSVGQDSAPVRSSDSRGMPSHDIILLDTIGELGAAWGLADIAFVGGSFDGQRGGQNMIEPAAYGAAVLFGPHTWNFRDTVARLKEHQGAIEVADAASLQREVLRLLDDSATRTAYGEAARALVRSQQGATERTLQALDALLAPAPPVGQAA
jgi:3-deoxy-D-manno-octulosonic-acid transferase